MKLHNLLQFFFPIAAVLVAGFGVAVPLFWLPAAAIANLLFATGILANVRTKTVHLEKRGIHVTILQETILPVTVLALSFLIALFVCKTVSEAFLFLCTFAMIGLPLGESYARGRNLNSCIATVFAVSSVMVTLLAAIFVFEQSDGLSFQYEKVLQDFGAICKSVFAEAYDINPIFATQLGIDRDQFASVMFTNMANMIPTYVSVALLGLSVVCYWLFTLLAKRFPMDSLRPQEFGTCRISRTGTFVYMIVSVISFFLATDVPFYVTYNFMSIMTYVFCYAGLSFILWFLRNKGFSPIIWIGVPILLAGLCILPFMFSTIIALVGMADSLYNLRVRLTGGASEQ